MLSRHRRLGFGSLTAASLRSPHDQYQQMSSHSSFLNMEKKEALPGDAPICTIFYAGLGGCVADLAPYQKAGIMVHSGDTIRSLTRSLPDDACLPPIWTSPVADAIEPYDLLTTASL